MKPSIDVIIPTYNGLPYLKEAVQSVLAQTHQALTLYVVDDGSTDAGATKKYVQGLKDPRVHYLHKPNGGQATARNYGITKSRADYVALLDADDVWYPDKLEEQLKLFAPHPEVGLVYGHHDFIDEAGKPIGQLELSNHGWIFDKLLDGNIIAGSGSMVLIKRSVFDDVGLFREDFLIGEDWEMWLRIAQKYQVEVVAKPLAALRERTDGMQKDYYKMANGLLYMLPIMLGEFKLSERQKSLLSAGCLWRAIAFFSFANDYHQVRLHLLKLFRIRPQYLLKTPHWRLYLRAFGGEWLLQVTRKRT